MVNDISKLFNDGRREKENEEGFFGQRQEALVVYSSLLRMLAPFCGKRRE
jgi:hypothetical protein